MNKPKRECLKYEGCNFLCQRLVLSCLSTVPIVVDNIRQDETNQGLNDSEMALINLISEISNGCIVDVNITGTRLKFTPGMLDGGSIKHDCATSRGIGYFLMPLMMLAPFCKHPIEANLTGITNSELDPTVDMLKSSVLPVLRKFITDSTSVTLEIKNRGVPPKGGGSVMFKCPVVKSFKPFQWKNSGMVKKIRGTAYTSRTSPNIANRMMDSAKKVLNTFLSDVYFTVDNRKGQSPGYGISLHAVTNNESHYSAEYIYEAQKEQLSMTAEDIGEEAAHRLLKEIYCGGCVDTLCQPFIFMSMALNSNDVSQTVVGALTPYSARFLRHIRDFFNVTFKIDEWKPEVFNDKPLHTGGSKLLMTCVGAGFTNMNKSVI